jgi:hypothetical protein
MPATAVMTASLFTKPPTHAASDDNRVDLNAQIVSFVAFVEKRAI